MNIWKIEQDGRIRPSFSDIRRLMNVGSFQSVIGMLSRLEKSGWITKEANKARSISLTSSAKEHLMAVGAKQIMNYKLDNTNTINNKGSDTTQAVGNNDISHSYINAPQNQNETIITLGNIALKHVASLLTSTSTTTVVYAKEFIRDFSYGPLTLFVLFLLFNKFTNFSFEQEVVAVIFCVLVVTTVKNYRGGRYVFSN